MGNTITSTNLQSSVRSLFISQFGTEPLLVHAPGRINLIGEHTDYHGGFVMPAAIDKGITMAMADNGTNSCRLFSMDLRQAVDFDLGKPLLSSSLGWPNYIIGVMAQLRRRNIALRGVDIVFGGDIPIGSGLSSSAALECSTILGLTTLWNTPVPQQEMVAMAQMAEHEFAGVKCGIMDQFASMMCKKNHAVLLDCNSLVFDYIPAVLEGCEIILFNTMVKHNLGDSEYNKRQQECNEGLEIIRKHYPKVGKLRDVNLEMLEKCKAEMKPLIYGRCLYVIAENDRVLLAGECLKAGNIAELGHLMYNTHDGLSRLYEVSCPELDFIVEECRKSAAVLGARMMGGGFGGCVIAIVDSSGKEELTAQISLAYKKAFQCDTQIYHVSLEDGAHIVANN